jgi:hypothetical protein
VVIPIPHTAHRTAHDTTWRLIAACPRRSQPLVHLRRHISGLRQRGTVTQAPQVLTDQRVVDQMIGGKLEATRFGGES